MSISRPAALVGVALLAGLLTGCTPPGPVTGTVVEKDYDAAESKRSCTGTGSKKKCRTTTSPADWDVTLRTASGAEVEVEVSQADFDRLQVGDTFTSR